MLKPVFASSETQAVIEDMDAAMDGANRAIERLANASRTQSRYVRESKRPPATGRWHVVVREHSGRTFDYKSADLARGVALAPALKKLLGKHLVIEHADDDVEVVHADAIASIRATWIEAVRS